MLSIPNLSNFTPQARRAKNVNNKFIKDEISSFKFDDYTNTLKIFLNGIDKPITLYDKDKVLFDKIFNLTTENANVIDIH